MVTKHGFEEKAVRQLLASAERKQKILDAISRPAEKTKPWFEYRDIFVQPTRIEQGVAFWQDNAKTLAAVSQEYGVEPEIIVAIIGVETRYGRNMGSYRVIDALTTLGFDYPRRAKFFAGELEHFMLLSREQKQDPLVLKGSYAGAMGYGQFIPSSYRHYARDFDGDGFADIWSNQADAIASVANYFKAHGWHRGRPVMASVAVTDGADLSDLNNRGKPRTTLSQWRKSGVGVGQRYAANLPAVLLSYEGKAGTEYQLGFHNFYVITRYNRSHMYARAVYELSQAIVAARAQALKEGRRPS